jgi:hypothetical protein
MYRIIAVCLLLLMTACGEADRVPKDVLSKEKMRDVLLDMNMADSYSGLGDDGVSLVVNDSVRQQRVKTYYRQILDLHKLTPQEFNHSYEYYESHPDKFKAVYDLMMTKIATEKSNIELEVRRKEYLSNRHSLLPVNNNPLNNSGDSDTLIPFVKKNKRGNISDSQPVKPALIPTKVPMKAPLRVPLPKLTKPK